MPAGDIADSFRYSNYAECVLWIVIGVLACFIARQRKRPTLGVILLGIFIVFGISDWIESTTGAWWRPWWLFVWKAACVVAIVGLLLRAKFGPTPGSASNSPPGD